MLQSRSSGALECEIAVHILGGVLPELDAFLALSAGSKQWRAAAADTRLWGLWRFQPEAIALRSNRSPNDASSIDDASSLPLQRLLLPQSDSFIFQEDCQVLQAQQAVIIIPERRIRAMPPFVRSRLCAAAEVTLIVNGPGRAGNLASFTRSGFHRLWFPKLALATLVINNHENCGTAWDKGDEDALGLSIASLVPFYNAKSLEVLNSSGYCLDRGVVRHLAQTCHGLRSLQIDELGWDLVPIFANSLNMRHLHSMSWCTIQDLDMLSQNYSVSLLQSIGFVGSLFSRDCYHRLFAMLKRDSSPIRFLAISTDTTDFEANFAQVFSEVPVSVQHLCLQWDSCHFEELHVVQDSELNKAAFNLVRRFLPGTVQLHVLPAQSFHMTEVVDVLRETFDASAFLSG